MGSRSVSTPAPVIVDQPSQADIRKEKDKERKDAARARASSAYKRMNSTSNVASQSRRTGFSGSGIYIPGAE